MLRLLAIAFVWLGCGVAWMILGSTLVARTNSVTNALDSEVHALWGPPGRQQPPSGSYAVLETVKELVTTTNAAGVASQQTVEKQARVERPLQLDGSAIDVAFDLQHRRKGLLWFSDLRVRYQAAYTSTTRRSRPGARAHALISDGSQSSRRLQSPTSGTPVRSTSNGGRLGRAHSTAERREYRGRTPPGPSSWSYLLTRATRVKNFRLTMATSFPNVDFPVGSTSPSEHSVQSGRWRGEWKFKSLVSGAPIGVEMPKLLNPGPLAQKVTFFAPLSLLFFFFVVAILALVRKLELHPMHYLLLGCAFFAFHLLFAYRVDHLEPAPSFAIASAVSVSLVVSYARFCRRRSICSKWDSPSSSIWCVSLTFSGKATLGSPSRSARF